MSIRKKTAFKTIHRGKEKRETHADDDLELVSIEKRNSVMATLSQDVKRRPEPCLTPRTIWKKERNKKKTTTTGRRKLTSTSLPVRWVISPS